MGEDKLLGEAEAIQERVLIPDFENGVMTGANSLSSPLTTVSQPSCWGCWLLLEAAQGRG